MIKNSAEKANLKFEVKEYTEGASKVCEFIIDGKIAGKSQATNAKLAKKQALEATEVELVKEAIVIKLKPNADKITISKDKSSVMAVVEKEEAPKEIDSNNIGFKMMQKLGWSGGGLGAKKDGVKDPISLDFGQKTRIGLGAKAELIKEGTNELNKDYCEQLLTDYCESDEIRDLKLASGFSKEQRAYFHKLAATMPALKSASQGKAGGRYLVLSKHISPRTIAEEILLNNNDAYKKKYKLKVPNVWKKLFPAYTKPIG